MAIDHRRQIDDPTFAPAEVSKVFTGKLDVSGQQPLHDTAHFDLHDGDPGDGCGMAMQDIQHGQTLGVSLGMHLHRIP